jgi:two-component system, sensor histidine kinase
LVYRNCFGPDAEAQRLLFQPFTQADGSKSRKYGGTGLGLSISKQLVEMMNGEIGVTRVVGEGSTFWFTAKFEKQLDGNRVLTPQRNIQQTTSPSDDTPRKPRSRAPLSVRILIAEDHVVNQKIARRQVESLGYAVDVVANGHEAVEALGRIPYALVLMDCQMPELDGLEATIEIRRREGTHRHTPIVAMTANAMDQDRAHCLAVGMDDYLSKPTEQEELATVIARWLEASPAATVRVASDARDIAVPDVEAGVAERLALFQTEFGAEMVIQVIESFIPDTAQRLVTLRQVVDRSDFRNLAREAHALKGGYGNMGAVNMRELCVRLEQQGKAGSNDGVAEIVSQLEQDFLNLRPALEVRRQALSQLEN